MQCPNPVYTNIHRFSKQEMMLKKFKCPNFKKGCDIGIPKENGQANKEYCFTYQEALHHMTECLYHTVACDLECGAEYKIVERDQHLNTCPNLNI